MKLERDQGKPGRVLVLEIPSVGVNAKVAGTAIEYVMNSCNGKRVTEATLTQHTIRLRTFDEGTEDQSRRWGEELEQALRLVTDPMLKLVSE